MIIIKEISSLEYAPELSRSEHPSQNVNQQVKSASQARSPLPSPAPSLVTTRFLWNIDIHYVNLAFLPLSFLVELSQPLEYRLRVNWFISQHGGKKIFEGLTTSDVCDHYIKKMTLNVKLSYCEAFKNDAQYGHKFCFTCLTTSIFGGDCGLGRLG